MPWTVRAGFSAAEGNLELSVVAGQEGAMAAPTWSGDVEQQARVRTRSRNRDQIRHSPAITQQGHSEEGGLRASQEAKPARRGQGCGGKPGRVVTSL